MWDSVILVNAATENRPDIVSNLFWTSGGPDFAALHNTIARLASPVLAYRLIAFLCILVCTSSIFLLCRSVPFIGDLESVMIAAIAMCYPFYSLWHEPIMLPYATAIASFLVAAVLYLCGLLSTHEPKLRWAYFLSAAFGFVLSFSIPSMLVLFYALFLYYLLLSVTQLSIKSVAAFGLRNLWALAAPPVYFLARRTFLPAHGIYTEYNQLNFSTQNVFKWLIVTPKRVVIDQIRDFLHYMISTPAFLCTLLMVALLMLLFFWRWLRRLSCMPINASESIIMLCYSAFLFLAATFPYSMVSKFPVVNSFNSRHALLCSIPIAIGTIGLFRFLLKSSRGFLFCASGILSLCISIQLRNYVLWQDSYIKNLAIVENLRDQAQLPSGLILIDDKFNVGMHYSRSPYEVNWITKQAYHTETHLGFDKNLFQSIDRKRFDELTHPEKATPYMFSDALDTSKGTEVEVTGSTTYSDLGIFVRYFLAHGESRSKLLRSLVSIRTFPISVEWGNDGCPHVDRQPTIGADAWPTR